MFAQNHGTPVRLRIRPTPIIQSKLSSRWSLALFHYTVGGITFQCSTAHTYGQKCSSQDSFLAPGSRWFPGDPNRPATKNPQASARFFCVYLHQKKHLWDIYRQIRANPDPGDPSGRHLLAKKLGHLPKVAMDFKQWLTVFLGSKSQPPLF